VTTLYSIERISALQQRARQVLRDLRIKNVHMKHGDGFEGWAAFAPFDGIIVARRGVLGAGRIARTTRRRRSARHTGRYGS
jgi:protein-L-isoaspartate O-methyltransferase